MRILIVAILLIIQYNLTAQDADPVLFTVEDEEIRVSEFDYIYSKNSGKDTEYSEKSLREYLDLYIKFKLKVQRAKELKIDTIPALMKELEGYRKQLAKSYLTDKEVTNRLVKEVFERSKKDVAISHILINLAERASEAQVADAYEKINNIKAELDKGMSWEQAVKMYSQDRMSKERNGSLGYLTSMFPNGFYELENTAYSLNKGEYSEPIRTKLGLHIVKLDDVRPARGEMEIGHILIRKKSQRRESSNPKQKIDSIYNALQGGANFEDLARKHSEDKGSASNGGYIGYFKINQYEKAFEDAAFGIEQDGAYSKPVESAVGWHIIRRISKKKALEFEEAKKRLKTLVTKDNRQEIANATMIDRIKKESNFSENEKALKDFTSQLDKTLYTYKWEPSMGSETQLLSFGNTTYSVQDFADYIKSNTRGRLRLDQLSPEQAGMKLYNEYVEDRAIKYEEGQLENKYPDFKAIMREYEEGILLFEVTKMNVWDKASQDTVGLKKFYEANKNRYMWKERAKMQTFVLNTTNEKMIERFRKKMKKKSPEWLKEKFGDIFKLEEDVYERGSRELAGMKFALKSVSEPITDQRKAVTKIRKITELIPATQKQLNEARGYIEADYQDQLEKEWVSKLRKKYDVQLNEDVFKSLIQ